MHEQKRKTSKIQENMALKAFTETDDLEEIKQIAQLHSKNQAIRTLDKLAHRQEYHEALARHGLGLDSIVGKLRDLIYASESEKIQLGAIQTLMKSIGIDKYDDIGHEGKSWEELLLDIHKEQSKLEERPEVVAEYEVEIPETPDKYKKMREEENELIGNIYDKK